MTGGLYLVLVEEPGKDMRALPGYFITPEEAVHRYASFQDNPGVTKFVVAHVVGTIG